MRMSMQKMRIWGARGEAKRGEAGVYYRKKERKKENLKRVESMHE
jgi:hypothetical protein